MPESSTQSELLDYVYQTVCKRRPELCEPRAIKMVCFDADDTIWEITPHAIASSISGPFKKIDDDTVEGTVGGYDRPTYPPIQEESRKKQPSRYRSPSKKKGWEWLPSRTPASPKDKELQLISTELLSSVSAPERLPAPKSVSAPERLPAPKREPRKVTIKLKSTFRKTLDELDKKGIKSSIISLNAPGTVKRIISAFGLTDRFVDIEDTWQNKGDVFESITERHKINPCNALFIDDSPGHVKEVSRRGGLALVIGKDGDVQEPIELLKYIRPR